MKTKIKIWNPNTGEQIVTLDELREMNCDRRKRILSNEGHAKSVQKEITVHDTDKSAYQLCCHYKSFELRKMTAEKAIEIFNHDGSQKAEIVK